MSTWVGSEWGAHTLLAPELDPPPSMVIWKPFMLAPQALATGKTVEEPAMLTTGAGWQLQIHRLPKVSSTAIAAIARGEKIPIAFEPLKTWCSEASVTLVDAHTQAPLQAPLESNTQLSSRRWRWWRFYRAWLSEILFQEITTELFFIDKSHPRGCFKIQWTCDDSRHLQAFASFNAKLGPNLSWCWMVRYHLAFLSAHIARFNPGPHEVCSRSSSFVIHHNLHNNFVSASGSLAS